MDPGGNSPPGCRADKRPMRPASGLRAGPVHATRRPCLPPACRKTTSWWPSALFL